MELLSHDILFLISVELDCFDLLHLSLTNKQVNKMCNSDRVWRYKLEKDYYPEYLNFGLNGYKNSYRIMHSLSILNKKLDFDYSLEALYEKKNWNLFSREIKEIPVQLQILTNMEILYLSDNQIKTIPSELKSLTNLNTLSLSRNQITTIPSELKSLTNLKRLYLSNNQITAIPSELKSLTNLKTLHLSGNQITTIPSELKSLTNLEFISLVDNQITTIPLELKSLTNLEIICLAGNQITIPPELKDLPLYWEYN